MLLAGLALLTFAFYGADAIASRWGGLRARQAKAQAAALYLFSYYTGSSVIGSLGGLAWQAGHWPGVVATLGAVLATALAAALLLMVQPGDAPDGVRP